MISVAFAAEHGAAHAEAFYQNPHFWVGISFFMVVVLAWRPVGKALCAALDSRAAKIRARLDEAQKLREDAQEMLATYRRKQHEAMKEAEDIIAHAKVEAERLAAQAAKDLEESLKRREQMAVERINQAETNALREVHDLAVDIAVAAARQVLAETITGDEAGKLVDGAIKDLPRRFH